MKPVNHKCLFYSDDVVLLDTVTPFIAGAMEANGAAIVFATEPHRKDLIQRLKMRSLDIDGAMRRGTYVSLDAAGMLSAVNLTRSNPSVLDMFYGIVESAAKSTGQERPHIAIFGEGAGLLYSLGHIDAAIAIEVIDNDLIERYKEYSIHFLCSYPALRWKQDKHAFESICAEHSAVHIG